MNPLLLEVFQFAEDSEEAPSNCSMSRHLILFVESRKNEIMKSSDKESCYYRKRLKIRGCDGI